MLLVNALTVTAGEDFLLVNFACSPKKGLTPSRHNRGDALSADLNKCICWSIRVVVCNISLLFLTASSYLEKYYVFFFFEFKTIEFKSLRQVKIWKLIFKLVFFSLKMSILLRILKKFDFKLSGNDSYPFGLRRI